MARLAGLLFSTLVLYASTVQGEDAASTDMISILIGGLGGGVDAEIITPTGVCKGATSTPQIPVAEFSSIFGWSAAVFSKGVAKEQLLLCGGKTLTETENCHSLEVGGQRWRSDHCSLDKARTNADMFTTSDGRVVVSGGYNERYGWLSDVQMLNEYDPDCTTDCCQWENIGTINGKGVYAHCSLQFDEDHFVFMGGNTWDSEGQYDIADVQVFNRKTGQWVRGMDMPIPRQGHGCIKTTHNGREGIMVAGGFCNGNPDHPDCYQLRIDQTIFYDFENDTWEELGALNHARDGLVLQNIAGEIYAIGGENRGRPVKIIEKWNGNSWDDTDMILLDDISAFAHVQVPAGSYKC